MKYIKDRETGLNIGIPVNGRIRQGDCTLQEVLKEKLRLDLDQFREAIRRIDKMRGKK